MRVNLSPSFILHQRPYRETSLLLDVFSRDHGRLRLVAKGARKSKKNPPALFQTHRSLYISWSGKGELGTLTEIESNGPAYNLNGNIIMAVFYLNELLVRLLHSHEPHPELFDAYIRALTRLEHGESESIALRYFERQLLESIGYGLVLDHDIDTGLELDATRQYFYVINHGPMLHKPANQRSVEISGASLLALLQEDIEDHRQCGGLKELMRTTLTGYLGEKPLQSRELYRQYVDQSARKVGH